MNIRVGCSRRELLALGTAAILSGQSRQADSVTAGASQDKTPRVGIVASDFRGSSDHDGTAIAGLAEPAAVDAALSARQVGAMLAKVLEIGDTRTGGLARKIGPRDWVVLKIDAAGSDPRVVEAVISWLLDRHCGGRFTIADGPGAPEDWSKAGSPYPEMAQRFSRVHPGARFEVVDLNAAPAIEVAVRGKPCASQNPDGLYTIAKLIRECDRLISIAALKTGPAGVALTIPNYLGIAPAKAGLAALGTPGEVAVDLFGFHPADYALAGETGAGRNLLLGGISALAVDALGASVLGRVPGEIPYMKLAWSKGFGIYDLDAIWTRGNGIEEVRRRFAHL